MHGGPEPAVTVVLPVYGRAELLSRAIESVVGQTLQDWELVVVDDASTIDLEPIVAAHDDPRMRYVRRPVNGGVAAAQNTGIDHARGAFVAFLHSDDELFPEKLARQVAALTVAPEAVGAVESAIEVAFPDHTEVWVPALDRAHWRDVLAHRTRVHISGLLVRKPVAALVRFDDALRGAEDRDFCVRLLQQSRVVALPEPLSRVSKVGTGLGEQNKGPIYEYLLDKYAGVIAADRRVHGDWHYRIACAFARAGDTGAARRALRASVRVDPTRPRRWLLWLASFGGDRLLDGAFGLQVRLAAARPSRHGRAGEFADDRG